MTNQRKLSPQIQAAQSETLRIIGTGDPIDPEDVVRFRLLYSGELLGATRGKTRADHKHTLRKAFSPQLQRLWKMNINLRHETYARGCVIDKDVSALSEDEIRALGLSDMFRASNYDSRFLPLISEAHCVRCRLDILFLRPEGNKAIVQGGDLDNRLKTLFDALRMPKGDEVQTGDGDGGDWFVLLEDDSLISEVSVVSDQLLLLPGEEELKQNDVFLVIDVQLQPTHGGFSIFQ